MYTYTHTQNLIYIYYTHTHTLMSDILLGTPSRGHTSVRRITRTYQQQICTNTGRSLEDLWGAMDDNYEKGERESGKSVLDICICVWACRIIHIITI